jgi:hypothetical protein
MDRTGESAKALPMLKQQEAEMQDYHRRPLTLLGALIGAAGERSSILA